MTWLWSRREFVSDDVTEYDDTVLELVHRTRSVITDLRSVLESVEIGIDDGYRPGANGDGPDRSVDLREGHA